MMATEQPVPPCGSCPGDCGWDPTDPNDPCEPDVEYAVRYDDHLVTDPSWGCIADVVKTYHGGFADDQGRVTGVLLRRVDGGEWVPA